MNKEMKSKIISIAFVNFIAIGFIMFTIFARFGTHIEVIKRVDCVPVDISYSKSVSARVVLVKSDEDDMDSFWVNAKEIFGTDKERELKEMIEDKESVMLNVFINPQTHEVLGVTKNGTSRLALIYHNHKLLKYGIFILLGVDVFLLVLILLSRKGLTKEEGNL